MEIIKRFLYVSAATFILFACSNKQEVAEQEPVLIEITKQQFETDSMQLGEIETKIFENTVTCNGITVPLPNGIARVNVPINGIIKSIYCFQGESVEKNQPLFEIMGNEIIEIQKEFAEESANFIRLKSEYERIKSLYDLKVAAEKDFIVAETEFKASLAKYSGLKMKIESIGLSISKIENGEFYSSYSIKSPIKGYITNLNATIGTYTDSQIELLEIINPDMLQVKLSVFANEIANIKIGQAVRLNTIHSKNKFWVEIKTVGVSIDEDSKSINCFANFEDVNLYNRLANMYVESEIVTKTDSVFALPSSAIIKSESESYILVLSNKENDRYFFKKHKVSMGRENHNYVEILGNKVDGFILTRGAYNININE